MMSPSLIVDHGLWPPLAGTKGTPALAECLTYFSPLGAKAIKVNCLVINLLPRSRPSPMWAEL